MNHHYELDWLYGWMVGDRAKLLGNCRWFFPSPRKSESFFFSFSLSFFPVSLFLSLSILFSLSFFLSFRFFLSLYIKLPVHIFSPICLSLLLFVALFLSLSQSRGNKSARNCFFICLIFRVYVKKMLQYVPIIGWAWKLSDVVFLERNWEKVRVVSRMSI